MVKNEDYKKCFYGKDAAVDAKLSIVFEEKILSKKFKIYFDSYGVVPIKESYENYFIDDSWVYNTIQVQKLDTKICGQLCCFVLKELTEGKRFEDIVIDLHKTIVLNLFFLKMNTISIHFSGKILSFNTDDVLDQVEANFLNERRDKMRGNLNMNRNKIIYVSNPIQNDEIVNKEYNDRQIKYFKYSEKIC